MSGEEILKTFNQRYPSMLTTIAGRLVAIARVVPKGKYGIEIKRMVENLVIAGFIAGDGSRRIPVAGEAK